MPTAPLFPPYLTPWICFGVTVIIVAGAAPAHAQTSESPSQPEKPKLAVLDVDVSGIPEDQAKTLSETLNGELDGLGRFEVISSADIKALLGYEATQQSLGCDDSACLVELGGALGAARLVVAQVGKIGATYSVNVKLLDVQDVKTLKRVSLKGEGAPDVLFGLLRLSVYQLFGLPAPPAVAKFSNDGGFNFWPLVVAGGGAVALGLGVGFGVKATEHYNNAIDPTFPGGQLEVGPGQDAQTIANVGFAVGGTLLSAGVTWLILDVILAD